MKLSIATIATIIKKNIFVVFCNSIAKLNISITAHLYTYVQYTTFFICKKATHIDRNILIDRRNRYTYK